MKSIGIINENQKNITGTINQLMKKQMIFRKVRRDAIGKSASNPTWGYAYDIDGKKMKWKGEGLYKEFDYDVPNGAYAEKLASIVARQVLTNVRVPEVDIVEEFPSQPSIISYKVMDNDKEDMFHIRDMLFNKFEREELDRQNNIYTITDILDTIKIQVEDEKNYQEIEKAIMHTLLLDSVINNGDRHANNWALVRDKETNRYELAIFDHSSCFTDLIQEQRNSTYNGWESSCVKIKEDNKTIRIGSLGSEVIKFISENYKEYFNEFNNQFNEKLPIIIEEIEQENLPINKKRLIARLYERKAFLNNIKEMEEER